MKCLSCQRLGLALACTRLRRSGRSRLSGCGRVRAHSTVRCRASHGDDCFRARPTAGVLAVDALRTSIASPLMTGFSGQDRMLRERPSACTTRLCMFVLRSGHLERNSRSGLPVSRAIAFAKAGARGGSPSEGRQSFLALQSACCDHCPMDKTGRGQCGGMSLANPESGNNLATKERNRRKAGFLVSQVVVLTYFYWWALSDSNTRPTD
jgi:hypothetical protein